MTNQPSTTENPVFVLCYSRSGSTLLRYILDTHPKIVCPPEMHLAIAAARVLEMCATALFSRTISDPAERRRAALPRVRQIVSQIMKDACIDDDKTVWCEKSVSTIDYVGLVYALFPQARFVCLHRNAFDFSASALEALQVDPSGASFGFDPFLAGATPDRVAGVFDYWCQKTQAILDFEAAHPRQCLRIHYEDLVADPDTATTELFGFLNLESYAGLIDRVFSTHHAMGPGDWKIRQTSGISTASIGRYDDATLKDIDAERMTKIDELHATLGYEALAETVIG